MDLTDIESFCKEGLTNIPGIKRLSIVDARSVSVLGDIAPGTDVFNIAFRRWSGSVSDEGATSSAGDYYTKTAVIYVPRYRFVCEKLIKQLKDRKVVVFVVDMNGENHRIDFASFKSSMTTDDSYTGSNGYRWTFTGKDRKVAFFADAPEQILATGNIYTPPPLSDSFILTPDDGGPSVADACCITILSTPILYTPEATGNNLHKNKVITVAATGDKYFIDKNGIAILLSQNGFTKEVVNGTGAHIYTLSSTYQEDRILVNRTQNVLKPDTPTLTNIDTFHIDGDQLILPADWPLEDGEYIEIYKTA